LNDQRSGGGGNGRVGVLQPDIKGASGDARSPEACLAEARGLAEAIDLLIVHAEIYPIRAPRPATLFGPGQVSRITDSVKAHAIDVVVVDGALTPVQQRNLEVAWNCKVIDRTGLILEIFGARARTREGRSQVELAALSYQRSRLVRSWTHLERQRGGHGFFGGPGETQIETDRRQIDQRIHRLRGELEEVKRTRGLHRQARRYPIVALVGYTNAGKSTLFNRLTRAEVVVADQLFATLDPTMRAVDLPSGSKVILSDTVGFISDLPTDLVAAFRATLEEVLAADIILHVRDISHPDSEAQKLDVHKVLSKMGLDEVVDAGLLEALNKIDLLDADAREVVRNQAARNPDGVPVSALTGEGADDLLALIERRLALSSRIVEYSLSLGDGAAIAWLYEHARVLSRSDEGDYARFRVGMKESDIARFERRISQKNH
jgi:GTP-binding protein HflX